MYFKQFILSFFTFNIAYSATTPCPNSKKHVIIIVADDLGWNDISIHGSDQFLTPNLDALAASGVMLHNYYVNQLCSPSRSALMSAIHPVHTGLYHKVIWPGQPFGLPLDIKIMPEYLKELGYKTHAIGKWHLGNFRSAYTPTERGFDSHFGYWTEKEDYFTHQNKEPFEGVGLDFRRNKNSTFDYFGKYATDLFTEESVDVIKSHPDSEPLFLYLAHLACHSANAKNPLQAPQEIINKFSYIKDRQRRIFAGQQTKVLRILTIILRNDQHFIDFSRERFLIDYL